MANSESMAAWSATVAAAARSPAAQALNSVSAEAWGSAGVVGVVGVGLVVEVLDVVVEVLVVDVLVDDDDVVVVDELESSSRAKNHHPTAASGDQHHDDDDDDDGSAPGTGPLLLLATFSSGRARWAPRRGHAPKLRGRENDAVDVGVAAGRSGERGVGDPGAVEAERHPLRESNRGDGRTGEIRGVEDDEVGTITGRVVDHASAPSRRPRSSRRARPRTAPRSSGHHFRTSGSRRCRGRDRASRRPLSSNAVTASVRVVYT